MTDTIRLLELPEITNHEACEQLSLDLRNCRGTPVHLDASNVRSIGALSAQLLAAARMSWHEDRIEMRIVNPSDGFVKNVQQLGLTQTILGED